MLEKQQETQRLRRKATEMGFELNIYARLGLVERKQQQRRAGNIEPKQLNQLQPEVIAKIYQHDEFLQRFTEQNQGCKNRHTAIIGEAGAGKTTLLSKIASYIQKNTENLFVFISLSNLEGRSLQNYLIKQWLPEAMGVSYPELDVTPEIEKKFIKRFRQGSVRLLLDGVDEMQNTTPLHSIQSQLKDCLNQIRVVLTCRNNVWDASVNNEITGFDTFKAQEFESEQVNEFIENWFDGANDKQQGDLLKAKLQEPGRERIRDLVRNPLRLSLLCQTFDVNKGSFPETKAALYKRFILYLQEWKQHFYSVDWEIQKKLHKALGKLALAGINSDTKFIFRESVARQEMGNSLFELARDVIWLHQVHRDIQTDEPVFAFFHPNFQEYFAALAIDDWDYFLKHVPLNPEQGTYRIFEHQWKEVVLLWLGRDNIAEAKKAEFLSSLCEFEDKCGGFYKCQAFFLAVAAIAEFKTFPWSDSIIEQLVKFGVSEAYRYLNPIPLEARNLIIQTNQQKITQALVNLIKKCQDENIILLAIKELIKIEQTNQIIKPILNQLIEKTKDEYNYLMFVWNLGKIDKNKQIYIKLLAEFIQKSKNEENLWLAAHALSQLEIENLIAINTLQDLAENSQNQKVCKHCIYTLVGIAKFNPEAIIALGLIIESTQNVNVIKLAIYSLNDVAKHNSDVIYIIVEIINNVTNTDIATQLILVLRKIAQYNVNAIIELGRLSFENNNQEIQLHAMCHLTELSILNPSASCIFKLILNKLKLENYEQYTIMLYWINIIVKDYDVLLNKALKSKKYENYQFSEKDLEFLRLYAGEDNKKIVSNYSRQIQNPLNNDDIIQTAVFILSDKGIGDYQACTTLLKLIDKSQSQETRSIAIYSLKSILTQDLILKILTEFKIKLSSEIFETDFELYHEFYQLAWYCARNIAYPDFFKAWHYESSLIQSFKSQFTNIRLQLKAMEKTFPILINAYALENETDTSAISQEICNQIYLEALSDVEPLEVNNAPQLKRLILRFKNQLKTQKLAIIIENCQPSQELIAFCRKITDVVSIAWITDEPLEAPLRGFPPNQPNLLNAIQSWINEIE
ncbi:NACHT domain-containing protein [Dulcicalothrix desertica]|nr:NACHT domain-containing protein [Dulcicalothrix desertica]